MNTVHKNVAILRVSDPRALGELRAVVDLDEHVMGWISDTEAVIDPHSLRDLLAVLDARGLSALVRRAGASGQAPEG
ncbi:MAG: hypothetical protein FJ102_08875 [Deltaproteobacteria bacterium]|nr:hypothetical protein [Deltaproteobacteria bacterium]